MEFITEVMATFLKANEDPNAWSKVAQGRANMKSFADFCCERCGKLYVKDQAVVQQGVCDEYGCSGVIKAVNDDYNMTKQASKVNRPYQCTACGHVDDMSVFKKNASKCTVCGESHIVRVATMDQVIRNTIKKSEEFGLPLTSAEHDQGMVYAYYSYGNDQDHVDVGVAATGNFTESDFIYLSIDDDGEPQAVVATIRDEKNDLFKYAENHSCVCSVAIEDSKNVDYKEYVDYNNRRIESGVTIEWLEKEGPVVGIVSACTSEGLSVDLLKHPEYGYSRKGDPIGQIVVSAADIREKAIRIA